jgi:zeaxanthin epoxidase
MMPNLGQGGCQAIEDAFILSETLELCKSTTKIESALQDFYKKRIVRVTIVQLLSRLASDLIINAFDTPWSPHDNLGKSWKSYLTFFWKPILQYAIFPAQFAYLYSYHPTGSMGKLPAALEAKWKKQHEEGAEAAFIRVSEDGQQIAAPSFFKIAEQQKSQPVTVLAAKRK